ncbi:MAG TPA: hemerythrin domain-containing protein [Usitatibacter sp.]|nr:hemerythrin domain-containing protein [Usitatibacter sp.]
MSTNPAPRYDQLPANDGGGLQEDVRDQLRRDHDLALAGLEALRGEKDQAQAEKRLRALRQLWMVHALAEETVVYRALEGLPHAGNGRADERFIEHELVGGLFDRLATARCGSLEWNARINVVRDIMARHMESEHQELFAQLAGRFDAQQLREMGERFASASQKLAMLERAKAA